MNKRIVISTLVLVFIVSSYKVNAQAQSPENVFALGRLGGHYTGASKFCASFWNAQDTEAVRKAMLIHGRFVEQAGLANVDLANAFQKGVSQGMLEAGAVMFSPDKIPPFCEKLLQGSKGIVAAAEKEGFPIPQFSQDEIGRARSMIENSLVARGAYAVGVELREENGRLVGKAKSKYEEKYLFDCFVTRENGQLISRCEQKAGPPLAPERGSR